MNKIIDPFTNKEIDFIDPFATEEAPEDKGGLVNAFGAGVDKLQELGYRAVKGFTNTGNDGDGIIEKEGPVAEWAQEGIDRNIEEQTAYEPTVKSYKDVGSFGDAASYAGELVANSLPYMAGAVTPIGATAMAGGLSQEAYEAQPEDEKNALRATSSGVGQMALERLGIKGSLGQIGKDILKDGVITTAKRYGKGEFADIMKDPSTVLNFSKRVLKGALWEGATEAMQEALAMWGAGKDLNEFNMLDHNKNNDDFLGSDGQRLMESFVGGATVGSVIRGTTESAQKLISWQKKSAPIAKNGIDELVKQGVTQDEAIEQVRGQLITSAMNQGLSEAEAAAAAARTMKTEYDIDHEIFTPIANDVASRRAAMNERLNQQRIDGGIGDVQNALNGTTSPSADELVQQQMQNNDPEFFEQLNAQEATVAESATVQAESEVNKVTKQENNLPLPENASVSEKDLENEKPQKAKIQGLEITEAPVNELLLSNDVPQFKDGANDKGVVEPLGGKFERTGVAPIQVWVRKDGKKEVISGRHRLDLAKRSGEQTIPAQYHYEEDGFNQTKAASLDAILNVREGQGKVKDYVEFIKDAGLSEKEADAQGILGRATGKRAYTIANLGSDSLITAHRNDGITDEGATRIAQAAPNNEALQAVGIKAINDGKSITVAENLVKAVKSMTDDQQQSTGDLFGFDDSAMIEAENLAKAASKKQAEIQRSLSAIKGAAKNPALAAKEGVNVKNPKAVNKRIEKLRNEKQQWDNWHTNPKLVDELTGIEPEPIKQETPTQTASQEVVSVSEPKENDVTDIRVGNITQEPDLFAEKSIDEAAHEAATSPKNDLAEPTIAQAEANNYKLGRIEHSGFKIGIENPEGSYRKGIDSDGKEWSNKINHHYGDLTGTKGADGDALDVFVKPGTENSTNAYIIDQVDPKTGIFDEHKIMLGFDSKEEAEKAYLSNYDKNWKGVGAISEVPIETFKGWVEKGNTIQAYAKQPVAKPVVSIKEGDVYSVNGEFIRVEQDVIEGDKSNVLVTKNENMLSERKVKMQRKAFDKFVAEAKAETAEVQTPKADKSSDSRVINNTPINDEVINTFKAATDAVTWLETNAKEPAFRKIAATLKKVISPDVKIVLLGEGQRRGGVLKGQFRYKESSDGTIVKNQIEIYNQGKTEGTLIHELIHAATARVIDNPTTLAQKEAINQLRAVKAEIDTTRITNSKQWDKLTDKEKTEFRTVGLSLDEFITYTLTNPHFQSGLKKLTSKKDNKTFFVKLGDSIKSLLGLNSTTDSIFAKAIDASSAVIDSATATDSFKPAKAALKIKTEPKATKLFGEEGWEYETHSKSSSDRATEYEIEALEKANPEYKYNYTDGGLGAVNTIYKKKKLPSEIKRQSTGYGEGVERIKHTTAKGKELTGIIDNDLTRAEAKAIDPFSFRKGKLGWFIRENRIDEYNEKNSPAEVVKVEPVIEQQTQATSTTEVKTNKKPKKNFSWDAVELSKNYTAKELNDWITELSKDPDNKNNAGGIDLYDKPTMKKIDKLGWAVTYLIQQDRASSNTTLIEDERNLQESIDQKGKVSLSDLIKEASDDTITSTSKEATPKTKVDKIDDFGEVLQGANKHNYTLSEKLNENIDITTVPLSKSFPQPDYEKLAAEGADVRSLAFMAQLRGEIKPKPRQAGKVERWSHQVSKARHNSGKLLEMGEGGSDIMIASLQKSEKGRGSYLKYLPLILDIAKEIPAKNIKALGNYKLEHSFYNLYHGEKNVHKWVVTNTEGKGGFGGMGNMNHFDTSEEAVAHIKSQVTDESIVNGKKLAKFDVWSERGNRDVVFLGKKVGTGKFIELKQFPTAREARQYINENNEELVALLKDKKKIKAHRRKDNNPRIGVDHRKGVNADAKMFNEAFGFKGVQFGNWVENNKRQDDLNFAYDGLMDLASVIGVPPKALSLNGELGLAFGARGKGGDNAAMAHYESGSVVINLTKKMGAGSLAHEWWHALDNYFSRMDASKDGKVGKGYITEGSRQLGVFKDGKHQRATSEDFGVRQEVYDAFISLTKAIKNETKLAERSAELDKLRGKDYWGTVIEMTARSFERYVIDKLASQGFESDYLANIVKESSTEASKEISDYPYPLAVEMDVVNKAYDSIFDILQTKETDQGVALFRLDHPSTVTSKTKAKGIPLSTAQSIAKEFIDSYNGNLNVDINVEQTQEELYGPTVTVEKYGRIKGAYNGEKGAVLGLVSGNLHSSADARETLRHEILGHYGLDTFKKADKQEILDKIIASQNEPSLKAQWDKIKADSYYSKQSINVQAEEVFAHTIESGRTKYQQAYDQVIAWLRKALRAVGLNKYPSSTSELRRLAETISKQIKSGDRTKQTNNTETMLRREDSLIDKITPKKQSDQLIANEDEGRINAKIRQFQDKFKPLKTVQEIISKTRKIAHDANAYVAEELFHGKVEEDLRKMERDYVQPLVDILVKHEIDMTELDLYVIAKHAKERNIEVSKKNDAFDGESGSGMTNDEAQRILDKAVFEEKRLGLEEAASKIYEMTNAKRELLNKSGLLSDSELASWESNFKYYVPLKGFANDEVDSNNQPIPRIGKGFAVKGRESMRALGRRTMAASPATQVIQDLTESIIRQRKNEVGNAFLKLVNSNPDKDYWEVFTESNPEVERKYNAQSGKVIETKIPMAMVADNYFTTKVDGETQYIKIKDDRLMMAMKNLGVDKVGSVVKVLGTINRYLSTINTSYNPEFMISNMARDIQTAVFNVQAEQGLPQGKIKGKNIAVDMVKDWVHARKGIALSLANKKVIRDDNGKPKGKSAEYQELFDQFREDGAKTGYFDMKDMDQQISEINTMLEISKNTNKGKLIRFTKKIGTLVENINQSVENAIRLSAYKQALDAFGDINDKENRQKAASLAKNLTVNFNRKGEVGTTMNALYMFANASVQGSAQFLRSMQGYTDANGKYKFTGAQKTAAIYALGAFTLAAVNRAFSDDDDDDVSFWDKIPSHIKERNIVIMKSVFGFGKPGDYISIPLPYGYNVFSVFGTSAEAAIYGNKTAVESAGNIVGAMIGSFSPIGSQDSDNIFKGVAKTITPTIGQPIVQLAANENFTGNSIYRENFQFGTQKPNSALSKRSTNDTYKAVSSWLNEASGGSYYKSGVIDISPEVFKYFVDFGTGAMGSFGVRSADWVSRLGDGKPSDDRQIPFYRKVSGETNDNWKDQDKFYERENKIKQTLDEYKSLKGRAKVEFKRANQGELSMFNHARVTGKKLTALRKRYKAIEASNSYASEEKTKKLDMNRKQQDSWVDKFNLRYNGLNK